MRKHTQQAQREKRSSPKQRGAQKAKSWLLYEGWHFFKKILKGYHSNSIWDWPEKQDAWLARWLIDTQRLCVMVWSVIELVEPVHHQETTGRQSHKKALVLSCQAIISSQEGEAEASNLESVLPLLPSMAPLSVCPPTNLSHS